MARKKKENIRKDVRKSLVNQLKAKGADIGLYTDKIDDYMALWDLKELYKDDIQKNGLRDPKTGEDSDSPRLILSTMRQMDNMLKSLKLSPDDISPEDMDGDL